MLEEGSVAPKFSALNQHGDTVDLDDLTGKWVALWWYPKASTPGWTLEGGGFRDRILEFEAANAVIVGASFDTVEEQKTFADSQGYEFSLLSDPDRVMGTAYEAVRPPDHPFVSLPERITYLISPDGLIAKAYDPSSAASLEEHSGQLLEDIKE